MIFHHLGLACADIEETLAFIKKTMAIEECSSICYDPAQQANLCMVKMVQGPQLELISGLVVKNYVKKGIYLYHSCWQVSNIEQAIQELTQQGALLVSPPKPAILFGGQKVAFLHSPLGLIELVEIPTSSTHPKE